MEQIIIKAIPEGNMDKAIELIMDTFYKYEAPDYTEEGIEEFKKAIYDNEWIKQRAFFGAYLENKLIGLIATKDKSHIALFFVDGNYHRRGIGRQLFNYITERNSENYFTVNSSPYAHEVYKHLGFEDTCNNIQEVNGLKFYPMKKYLDSSINSKNEKLLEITEIDELRNCLEIIIKTYTDRDEKLNLNKENNMRHSAMTFEQLKAMYDNGIKMYGYYKNSKLIAFISLEHRIEELKVKDIVVLPEYQSCGIGTILLDFAKEQAIKNNKEKIILGMIYANEKLRKWYEKYGFAIKEIVTYPSTGEVAKMEYNLK